MDSPRGFVVENLTSVRHREGFEELAGLSGGQPVSVGVTNAGVFAADSHANTFAAEVRKTLALTHPTIARTLAIDAAGPLRWAVAWERFEGIPLDQVVAQRGAFAPEDAVAVTLTLAQAVAHAHQRGLLHGGLSAEWVLVLTQPMQLEVKLAGFGLGLLTSAAAGRKLSPSVDVSGLGSILHLLLIGKPVDGGSLGTIPAPAMHLASVLAKSLGLDLSNRYRSVEEFVTALTEANRTRVSGGHVVGPAVPQPATNARTLGPWELQKLLGEGAMGQVFLAKHTLLGRQAAIKVLRPEQYQRDDLIQRFFQEARSVNQINHEHIVEISDFGQELGPDGKPSAVYFVMELLQGETLTARIAKGGLSVDRTLHVAKQLASALSAAHRLGVVHRDVKPDNVFLISRHGDAEYVKVLDFGVAKLTQSTSDAPKVSTMDGAIIGTPTSMSPEQASGGTVDARSDVYAVGVMLYQLLSGRLPLDAENFGKLVALLLTKVPDPLPPKTPNGEPIAPWLADLVRRCLEKEPAKRPQSMDELLAALSSPSRATAGSVATTQMVYPAEQRGSRRGLTIGLVVGVLGLGVALTSWFWSRPLPPVPLPVVVDAGPAVVEPPVVVDAGAPVVAEVDAGAAVQEPDAGAVVETVDAGAVVVDAGVATVRRPVKPVHLTRVLVSEVLDKSKPAINACLDRFQTEIPPGGTVLVTFIIQKEGTPSSVEVGATGQLQKCVRNVVSGVRFPPNFGNNSPVRWPLTVTRQ